MSRSIAIPLLWAGIAFFAAEAAAQTQAADALLARADNLAKQGQYDGALAAAKEALQAAESAFGTADPRLVKALKELGRIYELMARNDEAGAAYRRALTLIERLPAPDRNEAADLKTKLTLVEMNAKRAGTELAGKMASSPRAFATRELMAPPPPPAAAPTVGSSASVGGAALSIPKFPWPPPAPSARYVFPQDTFSRFSTAGEVSNAILSALERSGYVERSFFQTGDGGIALVTRIEKIGNDGSPAAEAERWPAGYDNNPASFLDFVRGLFYAKPGRYRVIVFVLQEASFRVSRETVSAQVAEEWLREGLNKLPAELASRPFGKESTCTALIYEFAIEESSPKPVASALTGRQHLEKAGLLAFLEKRN
jgi:tetratricopeptide (TPR) repeat protein